KFRSQPVWNFWFAASLNLIVRPKDCAGKVLLSRRAHAHDPALPSAPATQKTALPQWRPFPAGSRSSVGQVLTAVYQERYLALDHLLGHSCRSLRARPRGAVRGGRRPAARSLGYAGQGRHAVVDGRFHQARAGIRGTAPRAPRTRSKDRVDRLLRRAVDGRDLY